ncbi:alginate lyase family protein [Moritella sp. Urea-trap-13]|uniref:alginate lyase family protein n=1 Tax=Moritella sp. Urea-trap-13 TaxID=2058327 RepID=UPI000C34D0A5|nr:alginate lyase family protein [Moritella sp. Urea-trap-13]PKH07925.1 mannuronate-specific alginate lyase [Moritella sp. Urea-trap-13]
MRTFWLAVPVIMVCSVCDAAVSIPRGYISVQESLILKEGNDKPCVYPAPYTSTLNFHSRYEGSDSARDKVNKKAELDYEKMTKSIRQLQFFVSKKTDDIVSRGKRLGTLHCLVDGLLDWKYNSSLLEKTDNHTGKAVRKWTLAAISSSLLKLNIMLNKHEPKKYAEVKIWLTDLAEQVMKDYSNRPINKVNNHDYWAAWSVITTSAILDRMDLYNWSQSVFRTAMQQVDADGFLPNELRRQTRATMYHNYALMPLVGIAAFLDANNDKPFSVNQNALARLYSVVIKSVHDPLLFERETGYKQIEYNFFVSGRLSWLAIYSAIGDVDDNVKDMIEKVKPLVSSRLGGNLAIIYL